jgi:hypothetical protein
MPTSGLGDQPRRIIDFWRDNMKNIGKATVGRRELLTQTAPACAMACLGLGRVPAALAATVELSGQETHKFDVTRTMEMSTRRLTQLQNGELFGFIRNLRAEVGDEELIRLLKAHSAAVGRSVGEQQAANSPDTSFQTFVSTFRPPRYANSLTHEVVEDTENAFGLRVTECVWAEAYKEAGLDGEVGHAAVCNMDYYWPPAFNPNFKMERDRTLMQGHDHCNHRYMQIANKP